MAQDLHICDMQYQVKYTNTTYFTIGDIVFLTCNPECPMKVIAIDESEVTTTWNNIYGEEQVMSTPPQCLLHYNYAGLLIWKQKLNICLN